jgi:hypothetical protein
MFLESVFRKRDQGYRKYRQLALAIDNQIRQRTNGRIKQLDVKVLDGTVLVTGIADSYHAKQLAMEGIVDVLGAIETDVQLNIAVNYHGEGAAEPRETEASQIEPTAVG